MIDRPAPDTIRVPPVTAQADSTDASTDVCPAGQGFLGLLEEFERRELESGMSSRLCDAGEPIVDIEPPSQFIVLTTGVAVEYIRVGSDWTAVRLLGAGDVAGLSDVLTRPLRTHRIVAWTTATLGSVPRERVLRLIDTRTRFRAALLAYHAAQEARLLRRQAAQTHVNQKRQVTAIVTDILGMCGAAGYSPHLGVPLPDKDIAPLVPLPYNRFRHIVRMLVADGVLRWTSTERLSLVDLTVLRT